MRDFFTSYFMRAQELVRRAQEYISAHATQQEFRRRFLQIRLFLLRLFASLILGPTESFNFFTSQSRVEVCTESFFTHKQFHKTARLFSATTLSVIVASVVIISLILNLTISPALVGRAATFTSSWTTYNDFYYKTGGAGDASTQSNVTIADSGNPTNATLGTVKLSYLSTVIDSADTASNWVSSNETSLAVSQETTDKQEGTGSTKMVQTIATAIDGGTGADGTLDLSLGSGAGGCNGSGLSWSGVTCTIAIATKSTFNFTTINIPADTILTTDGPSITSNAVTIKATGNVTVAGTIDLAGRGYATTTAGNGAGYGLGGGLPGLYQSGSPASRGGGGGGGYGGSGGSGGTNYGGAGGSIYTAFDSGSGGGTGSSDHNGGSGGGGLNITSSGNISVSGTVNDNGTNGAGAIGGGGGGGSGGGVILQAVNLTISGSITANGGNGANYVNSSGFDGGGGGGGGGRITLEYSDTLNTAGSTITVSGGAYGTSDSTAAAAGSDGVLTQTSISGL